MATTARKKVKSAPPDVQALAERFMARFRGLDRLHGHSWLTGAYAPVGAKIEAGAETVHAPVTVDLWAQHLLGIYGVGQVPIRDDATCCFGAIDIDEYDADFDHVRLATQIDVFRLPLVVTRTKSGGAHLYLFVTEPVRADLMRGKLMEWAVALGFAKVEVYPKQTRLASQSDPGSWINMPYFAALTAEGTARYAVLQSGDTLKDPSAFLMHADRVAVTRAQLVAIATPMDAQYKDLLDQAPPCLQSLAAKGAIGRGSRNNGLFNIGVYLRKRFPDDWQSRLDSYNPKFLDPPLPSSEVTTVTKSLAKPGRNGGYFYRCTEDPIVHACNKQLCLTRKYGIGQGTDDPGVALGQIVKIDNGPGSPPIWLWDVNGKRVQLSTAELMSQARFNARVIEECNVYPAPIKPGRWAEMVREKLASAEIIQAPDEVTRPGMVRSLLHTFLTKGRISTKWDDAVRGQPIVQNDRVYFQLQTFMQYLKLDIKYTIEARDLWAVLREQGAENAQQRCGQKVLQLWSIPVPEGLFATDPYDVDTTRAEDI